MSSSLFTALCLLAVVVLTGAQVTRPLCPCPRIRAPVCGSDNITYINYCELRCAAQVKQIEMVKMGRC
ncbi:serine protease inhibitor dipetalogastin-like [Drosophila santomea]|uniref:serine protease inhibitor dipetalogastin-like n=1 Tax=Drosophila santomea TaxID=129105 RepID=UPI00195458D4|nr:serine protease inhibitor dipetalogastin-like [Drosophila santomea]